MEINERLQIIVDKLFNGNKAAFARAIDLVPTSISNYLSSGRKSKPSSDMLEKIVSKLGVNAAWLLTGEGEILKSGISITNTGAGNVANTGKMGNVNSTNFSDQKIIELEKKISELEGVISGKNEVIKQLIEELGKK